jgi:hypothetical protein
MLQQFIRLIDSLPYPTQVGCVAIAAGFILAGIAAPLKAAADRAQASRRADTKRKAWRKKWKFRGTLAVGGIVTGLGTWLTTVGGTKDAQEVLAQTRETQKETSRMLQTMLVALNAAKQQNTELLVQGKLRDIGNDFSSWAQDFANRKPEEAKHFADLRIAETEKEIELSSRSLPIFGAVLEFLGQAAKAYASRSAIPVKVSLSPLPQNLYAPQPNVERWIRFGVAEWRISANGARPAQENSPPVMDLSFSQPNEPGGNVRIWGIRKDGKFSIGGSGTLPAPGIVPEYQDYDASESGPVLRKLLQRLLEAQLSAPTPAPTATATATASP